MKHSFKDLKGDKPVGYFQAWTRSWTTDKKSSVLSVFGHSGFEITCLRLVKQFCSLIKTRLQITANVTDGGFRKLCVSFKNLLVVKNISRHYNVPIVKSSFCQLIDSFEAKCFNGVPFVDPFYSLHGAKVKTSFKIFCLCQCQCQ